MLRALLLWIATVAIGLVACAGGAQPKADHEAPLSGHAMPGAPAQDAR
jgi:hypothetical protein